MVTCPSFVILCVFLLCLFSSFILHNIFFTKSEEIRLHSSTDSSLFCCKWSGKWIILTIMVCNTCCNARYQSPGTHSHTPEDFHKCIFYTYQYTMVNYFNWFSLMFVMFCPDYLPRVLNLSYIPVVYSGSLLLKICYCTSCADLV